MTTPPAAPPSPTSIAESVRPLVEALVADAARLRLAVSSGPLGARIVDAGIAVPGGIEAGRRIAEICMGGRGRVALTPSDRFSPWSTLVSVSSEDPVMACLASQYAGWSLAAGDFFALGSGPGRAVACVEPLFAELGYADKADTVTLVLETAQTPPEAVVAEIAARSGVPPQAVTLILTPTASLAGTVQIVARTLEVALHKAHALHFPLARIVDGLASAPLPPPAPDFLAAMGRTNDAVLYGGDVHLFVSGPAEAARDLSARLPSGTSRDHGRPFAEVFAAYGCDFYQVDPLLFSPARVTVSALEHGASFTAGSFAPDLVARSFGG
ncbi:methenyltetrahydromethanopterin cyclohydrolase [Xanthobacter tagetidis]|uniref:Methenyltetrahydromethanopterin cyclohydrolase n=1 Tax=Xanthobacter tagetidis TaxID=60216 RepID=A0A3L7A3C4_9HYPH|nr:methenyltetrahydromethanopterin cyclohydrolase [Xanthobacter tagetidis]MBB6308789.1 methenyltetrahydromethanopterin cyclohydrolase [Xanthobacter tagetidis]RLP74843.1 methenyltetrahydromethanopterin cyclohydrolase [Xanthobacter tagetidis]